MEQFLEDALTYWESKRAGRRMPARRDLDPVLEIPNLLRWIILVDVLRDPLDFRYRVIGSGVVDRSRQNYTGKLFSELSHIGPDSLLWKQRANVVETAPRCDASRPTRLWCRNEGVGGFRPFPQRSGDPAGHRHAEAGHDVDDFAGDLGLGLLCRRSPGVEAATDHLFVPEHRHLRQKAFSIVDRSLPSQPATLLDQLDVSVALGWVGCGLSIESNRNRGRLIAWVSAGG